MELWIRSQDKELLVKVKDIELGNFDEEKCLVANNLQNIGKYKTKERALEVLDEIQEAQLGNYHYRCPSNVKASNNENTIVYEMPHD